MLPLNETPNNTYFITYTNHFYFEGQTLAFRKKQLFNITKTPVLILFDEKYKFWLVNRKQLTISKIKEIMVEKPINVDVSDLQWYQQLHYDHIFNL